MITWSIFGMMLFSVACSALAQILLKHGMSQPDVLQALASGRVPAILASVATSVAVPLGLVLFGFGVVVWLLVLSRVDVSVAYPFVALGFLVTMTLGCMLLGEALTLNKVFGTLAVVVGVFLVAT